MIEEMHTTQNALEQWNYLDANNGFSSKHSRNLTVIQKNRSTSNKNNDSIVASNFNLRKKQRSKMRSMQDHYDGETKQRVRNKLFQNLPMPPRKPVRNMEQLLEEEENSDQTDGLIILGPPEES